MCAPDQIPHASSLWLIIVTLGYFVFAVQIFSFIHWKLAKRQSVLSLGAVVVVFVFCGLAHATSVLPPSYWPFRDALYAVLSFAILAVIVDRKAARMMAAMMEKDIDGKDAL